MRQLARTFSALALLLIAAFVPAATASAKTVPTAKWAKKNHLKGAWRSKDADKDGLKNLAEFKAGTNPRKADTDKDGLKDGDEVKAGDDPVDADSDGDGVKDGAEHAGVVTAFDGDTVTIRQFKGGKLTATLSDDADCSPTDDSTWGDDSSTDDTNSTDDTSGDDSSDTSDDETADDGADASTVDDDPTVVDVGSDDDGTTDDGSGDDTTPCDDSSLAVGDVVRKVLLTRDGGEWFADAVEVAGD